MSCEHHQQSIVSLAPQQPDDAPNCPCGQRTWERATGCDSGHCPIDWYHCSCAGVDPDDLPLGDWICANCETAEEARREAETEEDAEDAADMDPAQAPVTLGDIRGINQSAEGINGAQEPAQCSDGEDVDDENDEAHDDEYGEELESEYVDVLMTRQASQIGPDVNILERFQPIPGESDDFVQMYYRWVSVAPDDAARARLPRSNEAAGQNLFRQAACAWYADSDEDEDMNADMGVDQVAMGRLRMGRKR